MAGLKTKATALSVGKFIDKQPEAVRADCRTLVEIMKRVSGMEPTMWGPAMIGFGRYHYRYTSGHEGDMFLIGFSPRKAAFSLYGFGSAGKFLEKLGKHKRGKGCLYIKKLADVDLKVLEKVVASAFAGMKSLAVAK